MSKPCLFVQTFRQLLPAFFFFSALAAVNHAAVAADAHRERFQSVTADNFDSGGEVSRQFHLHPESYLRATTIPKTGVTRPLPESPRGDLDEFTVRHDDWQGSFANYVAKDSLLDGVLVLHKGRITFERYNAMQAWQRHYGWSVTKVLTSAALAALVSEGLVDMQKPVEAYLPYLSSSAWSGTSLKNISDMASGIDCRDSDGYQDKKTCVYRMEESLGVTASTGSPVSFIQHLQAMGRHRPPGTRNEYVSANTNVLMLVMEAVTSESYAEIIRTRIWDRIGAESDALMTISHEGHAYASGGLTSRLRDLGRFGLLFTDPELSSIVKPMLESLREGAGIALTDEALKRRAIDHPGDLPSRAGWQWDRVWDDGGLFKGGYSGQGLYVDPDRDLVIAWFGTGEDYSAQQTAMDSVARQLARSGLFERKE